MREFNFSEGFLVGSRPAASKCSSAGLAITLAPTQLLGLRFLLRALMSASAPGFLAWVPRSP